MSQSRPPSSASPLEPEEGSAEDELAAAGSAEPDPPSDPGVAEPAQAAAAAAPTAVLPRSPAELAYRKRRLADRKVHERLLRPFAMKVSSASRAIGWAQARIASV